MEGAPGNIPPELARLRRRLDALDGQLAEILRRRLEVAEEVGRVKAELKLPINDPAREQEVLENYRRVLGDQQTELLERLVDILLEMSREKQKSIPEDN